MLTRIVLAFVAAVLVAWALAHLLGLRRWSALTAEIRGRMQAVRTAPSAGPVDFARFDTLPPPVARYLRTVLRDGQPRVDQARFVQGGQFNLSADGERWLPFRADQVVQVQRPGFDWDARVRLAPGLPIRVHDAYAGGTGWLRASLLGLVDVANLTGGGAVAEGELMRWLAEAPWYPTALVPGAGVQWRAIDERSAEATVVDGDVRVSLVFLFGDDGLVSGVRAPARARTVGKALVPTPWEGRFRDYRLLGGMRVPTQGEVGWHVDGRFRPYWRGRTEHATYD